MKFYTSVTRLGNFVIIRGYEDGKRFQERIPYRPKIYAPSKNSDAPFKSLYGQPLEELSPGNMKETREFLQRYEGVDNFTLWGMADYQYACLSDEYSEEIDYSFENLKVIYLDIETECENGFPDTRNPIEKVNVITIKFDGGFYVFGIDHDFKTERENVKYFNCYNERDLFERFIETWERIDPDIVTGWNSDFFDIPYLISRSLHLFDEKFIKRFSPLGKVTPREIQTKERLEFYYDIAGISCLDYMRLYKKFILEPRESHKLDHISEVEVGHKKLDHSEFTNYAEFYRNDYQKYIEYNIVDVELVQQIDEKRKLLELAVNMAYLAKTNFEDVYSPVKWWDIRIYNHLKSKNIVIPFKEKKEKTEKFKGAYVKEPVPGMYGWVVSFDVNSLYPNVMRLLNLSPETLVEGKIKRFTIDDLLNQRVDMSFLKEDETIGANGQVFRKDKRGFIPELIDIDYENRVNSKAIMLEAKKELEAVNAELQRRGIA